MTDPSARITRVDVLRASPGCCAICGKSDHPEGFAATDNFDFEFYGTVYFCADCVGDYARVFGYKSPSELDDLLEKYTQQAEELKILRQAVVLLENAVDNLTGLGNLRGNTPATSDRAISDPVAIVPAASEDVTESSDAGEGEQLALSESSVESGPDDVRDVTSTDSTIDELLAL